MKYINLYENFDFEEDFEEEDGEFDPYGLEVGDIIRIHSMTKWCGWNDSHYPIGKIPLPYTTILLNKKGNSEKEGSTKHLCGIIEYNGKEYGISLINTEIELIKSVHKRRLGGGVNDYRNSDLLYNPYLTENKYINFDDFDDEEYFDIQEEEEDEMDADTPIGTRVKCIKIYGNTKLVGLIGTIVGGQDIGDSYYHVIKFDEMVNGHSGDIGGYHGEDGYHWNFPSDEKFLEII